MHAAFYEIRTNVKTISRYITEVHERNLVI